jgi:phage N-6-adenine-methyltransferase
MNKVKLSDYWETPWEVFEELNRKFGPFDFDAAATVKNSKCPKFLSEEDNSLSVDWASFGDRVWLNPPYSDVTPWLKKAKEEASKGVTTVLLMKDDHTTQWYKNYIYDYSKESFYPGVEKKDWPKRIKYLVPEGMVDKDGKQVKSVTPPWGNCVVIFWGNKQGN